jgi:hypothetical protein
MSLREGRVADEASPALSIEIASRFALAMTA